MTLMTHQIIGVAQAAVAWEYKDLFENDTTPTVDIPRSIILHNTSDADMYVYILDYNDDTGLEAGDWGIFLKAGGQLSFMNSGRNHRVGVILTGAAGADKTLVISCLDFATINKIA